MTVLLLLMFLWLGRAGGPLMGFDSLDQGYVFSPIIFALAFPTIQAFVHVLGANSAGNK